MNLNQWWLQVLVVSQFSDGVAAPLTLTYAKK